MEKQYAQNPAIENILTRRSIRSYTDQDVEPEKIEAVLEAGMAAPSGKNGQPWDFIVLTRREILDEMAERLILVCKKYAYSTGEVDAFPYLTELYRFAQDNADLCLVLLGPNGDRAYTERICGILRSYFLRDFLARFCSGSSDRLDYFCSFIVSGNLTLTLEWLSGGAKETPEEMAALAGAIIMDGVRTL